MKNTDLTTTIANIVISLALLTVMTILLVMRIIDFSVAGYFLTGVFAIYGFTGALKAPSPGQGDQIAQAIAAAAPQVPLVNITHPATSAPGIQVSSSAMPPVSQQGPHHIILPQVTNNTPIHMFPPQGQVIPFPQPQSQPSEWQAGTWQAQPPLSENSMPLAAISRMPPTQQQ